MNATTPPIPKTGCALFTSQGGAISPQTFEQYPQPGFIDYYMANNSAVWKPGHFVFRWVSRLNEGTAAEDIAILGRGLRDDVCAALLNMTSPPATLPSEAFIFNTRASQPAPGNIASFGSGGLIDEPVNLYSDVFVSNYTDTGRTACMFGMILVSR